MMKHSAQVKAAGSVWQFDSGLSGEISAPFHSTPPNGFPYYSCHFNNYKR